jgi:hypothetical protein
LPPAEERERDGRGMPLFLAVLWDAAIEIFAGVVTEFITGQEV